MIPRTSVRKGGEAICRSTQARQMATQAQLVSRIKSVVGIEKITKAVQMEASAKLRRMEQRLAVTRQFANSISRVWPDPPTEPASKEKDFLLVVISADRGLCGSFNSSLSRDAKKEAEKALKEYKTVKMVFFGNKSKQVLEREYKNKIFASYTDLLKTRIPSFRQSLRLGAEFAEVDGFDQGILYHNSHKNVMTFDRKTVNLFPRQKYKERVNEDLVKYELEGPDDILDNLYDFRMAVNLWLWLSETEVAQTAARMTAMQNASKNTEDMLKSLRLEYNKTRQTKITTELCEIVSGASALKGLS
jgi:ATP synthase F1 gamma subunit